MKIIPFRSEYPFLLDNAILNNTFPLIDPNKKFHVVWARWFLYYFYLTKNGGEYSRVLITDIRDVVFQRNPFDFEADRDLCFFLADQRIRFEDNPWNSESISDTVGDEFLADIKHNIISNAGTVFGTPSRLLEYLKIFLEISSFSLTSTG